MPSPPEASRSASACRSRTTSSRPMRASRWKRRRPRATTRRRVLRPRRRSAPSSAGTSANFEDDERVLRHCEERGDEAIQLRTPLPLDCFALLAMTEEQGADSRAAVLTLLSAAAVRERAHEMLAIGVDDRLDGWRVDLSRLDAAAERTAAATREAYPNLAVPFHARWRHF